MHNVLQLIEFVTSADSELVDDNTDCRTSVNAGVVVERRDEVGVFAAVEDDLLNFAVKDSRHLKLGLLAALLEAIV